MVEYTHELQSPHAEAFPNVIKIINVEYPLNISFLGHVKRYHSTSQVYNEWMSVVHTQETHYFSHFTNTNERSDKLTTTLD